jgi:hypothetical protein
MPGVSRMFALTHTSAPTQPHTCDTDKLIWAAVSERRPGWPLQSLSLQLGRADSALMFSLVDAAPPAKKNSL